jgi:hypothetical protein
MGQIEVIRERDLVHKTSRAVLASMFKKIATLAAPENCDEEWFNTIVESLEFSKTIELGFHSARAVLLSHVKKNWDDLPLNVRMPHDLSFYNFAKVVTENAAKSTIDGYVYTANIWYNDKFGENKTVVVTDRTIEGKPIIEDYKIKTKTVLFEPHLVGLSKLNILNSRAVNNDMTPKLWEMLVDDFYTCEDLRIENRSGETLIQSPDPYTLRYVLDGPNMSVQKNGDSFAVAEFNWTEYETNPIVKEAIDHLLKMLNIEMDEDIIYKITRRSYESSGRTDN